MNQLMAWDACTLFLSATFRGWLSYLSPATDILNSVSRTEMLIVGLLLAIIIYLVMEKWWKSSRRKKVMSNKQRRAQSQRKLAYLIEDALTKGRTEGGFTADEAAVWRYRIGKAMNIKELLPKKKTMREKLSSLTVNELKRKAKANLFLLKKKKQVVLPGDTPVEIKPKKEAKNGFDAARLKASKVV